ncbi:MAG: M13 family metallopeptidase [Bacteroidetes bacterium]|nr:M13 family metallopeptidase [Bacteroidota bacterium]
MKKAILSLLILNSLTFLAQKAGINFSYIDSSANPRNDFYTFCNGKWQKTFVLPASDARYGSFNEINNNNLAHIKVILNKAAANKSAAPNTNAQKLRDFYNNAMDSANADKLGFDPIKEQLTKIDKIKDLNELMVLKSSFDYDGVTFLFGSAVSIDPKNSKKNIFNLSQAGLGLGEKDFYYNPQFEKIRVEYLKYLSELFALIGTEKNTSMKNAEIVFEFEKHLADKALTRLEMRDPEKLYNIYSPAALKELTPAINWNVYFTQKKIKQPDTVLVATVEYFKNLNSFLASSSIETLKLYCKAQLLMEAAPFLSRKFEEVNFAFKGKILSGASEMKPRWQRVQSTMDRVMGDIVSEEFVKEHFTPKAKAKVNSLIDNLVLAYRERIASRTWMDTETKKQANRKLDLLIRKVGYPEKWKDYSLLTITTDNYWANYNRGIKFALVDNLGDLKKPADRSKWQMTPVTVNAYYDPTTNEITFPAAILQPPFFDAEAEDAANYGTMGAIIGHELTHGFDDQGAQFDADGNMKMWWTKQDYDNFKSKTSRIVNQFNKYVAIDSTKVNGSMTQGENIADLGGLTMAYYAYQKSLKGKPSLKMGGYTGEQRFFIAWAQGWKGVCRDAELKRLLTVDYHSPAYFRSFAPLSNLPEFYKAFGVKEGDKMFTPETNRVEIW